MKTAKFHAIIKYFFKLFDKDNTVDL